MRVIVLQKNHKLDSKAAEEFGKRIYILDNYANPFDTDRLIKMYRRKLKQIHFDPEKDVVCLTGPSILLQLFLVVLANKYDNLKVLMFNAPDHNYKLRTLELNDGKPNRNSQTTS